MVHDIQTLEQDKISPGMNPGPPATTSKTRMNCQSVGRYHNDYLAANQCRSSGHSKKLTQCFMKALCFPLIACSMLVCCDTNKTSSTQMDPFFANSFFAERHQNRQQTTISDGYERNLPEITADRNPSDELFLKTVDYFLNRIDEMHGNYSVSDLILVGLVARAQGAVYLDIFSHHYDNPTEMKRALGPGVDNEACVKQLENLVQRTRRQEIEKYRSKDLNLFQLFDTWGRVPAGVLLGYGFFEGAYNECLKLKIKVSSSDKDQPSGGSVQTRYCVLTTKHKDWPRLDKHDLYNMKMGICIPKTCDSSNYKNKYDLIMRLAQNTLRPFEVGEIKFNGLYCLPDEDSPMRSILHNPKSFLVLVALCLWLSTLLFATWKHHQLSTTTSQNNHGSDKHFGLTNMQIDRRRSSVQTEGLDKLQNNSSKNNKPNQQGRSLNAIKIYELLSITNNLARLFDTSKESSLMKAGERLKEGTSLTGGKENGNEQDHYHQETGATTATVTTNNGFAHDTNTTTSNHRSQPSLSSNEALQGQSRTERQAPSCVDLRCVEGVKVMGTTYVIIGHTMMCISTIALNSREVVEKASVSFVLVNLVAPFTVNCFFVITGILTCYLIFKQQQTYSFITSPGKWLAFIVYRYLRIMPMYAIVVLYCKYLAKFINSGPLWDYGTSSLGQRKICEQESWWWTLTFTANFLRPFQHCIPSAWYLPNDFQFFLVTPIFLAALFKRPLIGRCIILASIVASIVANFYNIYGSDVDDLRPIASFEPHGFKTYVSHFSSNYTNPQYRIPAYLIGLLLGHQLYQYDVAASEKRLQSSSSGEEAEASASSSKGEPGATSSGWSAGLERYATSFSALLILISFMTSAIGSNISFTKWAAKFLVALMMPIFHVQFSLAVGIYLYIATTGRGSQTINKFLSAPQWKPLARLSLCVLLVNIETINYIVQGSPYMHAVTPSIHIALNCLCILATYLVATILCVLFEAPIRGALNIILTLAIKKAVSASKKSRPINGAPHKEKIF
uniref:Nose resistant to fluoxetine protein 6 n=1 Tax=Aceria tosichella TaxID=561515 RepID=A0A6G1SNQ9_9ACAR